MQLQLLTSSILIPLSVIESLLMLPEVRMLKYTRSSNIKYNYSPSPAEPEEDPSNIEIEL